MAQETYQDALQALETRLGLHLAQGMKAQAEGSTMLAARTYSFDPSEQALFNLGVKIQRSIQSGEGFANGKA